MDPWDTSENRTVAQNDKTADLHALLNSHRPQHTQATPGQKRVVYPAVPFMTVKDERKCLSEIRSCSENIRGNFTLSNGMTAEDFALMYVLGHQLKRKEKQTVTAPC